MEYAKRLHRGAEWNIQTKDQQQKKRSESRKKVCSHREKKNTKSKLRLKGRLTESAPYDRVEFIMHNNNCRVPKVCYHHSPAPVGEKSKNPSWFGASEYSAAGTVRMHWFYRTAAAAAHEPIQKNYEQNEVQTRWRRVRSPTETATLWTTGAGEQKWIAECRQSARRHQTPRKWSGKYHRNGSHFLFLFSFFLLLIVRYGGSDQIEKVNECADVVDNNHFSILLVYFRSDFGFRCTRKISLQFFMIVFPRASTTTAYGANHSFARP